MFVSSQFAEAIVFPDDVTVSVNATLDGDNVLPVDAHFVTAVVLLDMLWNR